MSTTAEDCVPFPNPVSLFGTYSSADYSAY